MSDLTRKRRDPGTTWALVTLAILYFIWYQGMSHSKLPLKASPPVWEVSALAPANLQAKAKIFKGEFKYERTPYPMSEAALAGMKVFEEHCLGCHGPQGAGNGPSANWMMPKPRNFQSGIFKFITSKSGTLPDREDLLKTITYGLPGSSMPDFRFVPPSDRDNLVEYVLFIARNARRNNLLSRLVAQRVEEIWSDYGEEKPEAISDDDKFSQATLDEIIADNLELLVVKDSNRRFPESSEPEIDMDGLVIGAQKFAGYCASCHGPEGRGGLMLKNGSIRPFDGRPISELAKGVEAQLDDFGEMSIARNLGQHQYRHGKDALSLWYRIKRGLDGAVMPAADGWTADEAWHTAHYIQLMFDKKLQSQFSMAEVRKNAGLPESGASNGR